MRHPFFDVQTPWVIGHRGAAGTHPENTLVSFAAALDQGADVIESDIQATRDGVPVLLHDPDTGRTCDCARAAHETHSKCLAELDTGHAFALADGDHPFRGRGLTIPRLAEAFEQFPDARFNLELKTDDARALRATLELVARFDRADRTLLTSGDDAIMNALRRAVEASDVRPALGACFSEIVASVRSALGEREMPPGVMALQVPPTFAGAPLVTRAFVEHARRNDVAVHVWTINEHDEVEALRTLGVEGFVTDFPGRLRGWLDEEDAA